MRLPGFDRSRTPVGGDAVHRLYARWLRRQVTGGTLPDHVGIIMDGNRRWARANGLASASLGHRHGAEHLQDLLGWCRGLGITHVTAFVCSAENLVRRDGDEITFLMGVVEDLASRIRAEQCPAWSLHVAGNLDVLPASTARALKAAAEATRHRTADRHLTLAVGYGGRQEVVDAVRELLWDRAAAGASLQEVADTVAAEDIAARLYTAGQPEPDLVIRTSGEQRLSNFLLWQSAYSELYFCDTYWPAFREIDFLRALRSYAARNRRYGG
jgi:short-chain Z-isoprenyl diphosphate synthase